MLRKLEGLYYINLIELNLAYYLIRISEGTSNMCILFLHGENAVTSIYQWELTTHKIFSTYN